MKKITEVSAKPGYILAIVFEDGVHGEISLANRLFGPMFEPLRDSTFFSKASVDSFGAITWPNGADLAPDAIYERLISKEAAQ